ACSGASIIKKKLADLARSSGTGSRLTPNLDPNRWVWRLTALMSSFLTTAQNPASSCGNGNSVGGCQLTGASRRSRPKLSSRSSNDFAQNASEEMSTSMVRSCDVAASFMTTILMEGPEPGETYSNQNPTE